MSFRAAAPPRPSAVLRLLGHDELRISRLAVGFFCAIPASIALTVVAALWMAPPWSSPLQSLGVLLAGAAFFGATGAVFVPAMRRRLRYLLEIHESGLRLVTPAGEEAGATSRGTLSIDKTNYVRAARYARYLRPGFHLRHAKGDHLVGALWPEDSWEQPMACDPRRVEFELDRAEWEALCEAFAAQKT